MFLGPLEIVDVCSRPVALNDLAVCIPQRVDSDQRPSVASVFPSYARLGLERLAVGKDLFAQGSDSIDVIGVKDPPHDVLAVHFLARQTEVVKLQIRKIVAAVPAKDEHVPRDRINDRAQGLIDF